MIYGRKFGTSLTMDVFRPARDANGAAVILVISGNGLKTLDAFGLALDEPIAPTFSAFEQWWTVRGGAA